MDYITILGSCRQIPIREYLNTSNILDKLNYPHYTKEILQQIRYLKYRHIPDNLTSVCFRNGLLSRCSNKITDDSYTYLKDEFNKSTFFLVEIASKLSYKWNDLYLHHIAEDQQYNFNDRDNIIKHYLTDEEIEDDIIQIRNELYPKPFIILSHFATYSSGKRYELIKLLENICQKLNIPFINQSDLIKQYGTDIILKEPVLAHYTKEGLKIVGKFLYNKINEVKSDIINSKQTLYQVYYTSDKRVKENNFHGFGDYIRGTIHLYQLYGDKINLKVNFSNHHLSKQFICDNHLTVNECEQTKYIFRKNQNFLNYTTVFTNNLLIYETISEDCKKFIIKNCLTPRICFEKKITDVKNSLCINDYNYSVIHIRLNDNEKYNENTFNNIKNIILNIKDLNPYENFLLISSNDIYLNKINLPFIKKTNLSRAHIGLNTASLTECEDTMIEFMLMTRCKQIFQLSVYSWGSGFSDTINKIYDVPVIKYKI